MSVGGFPSELLQEKKDLTKDNALYGVVDERPVPQHRQVLKDQTIRLTGAQASEWCPFLLRQVEVWNPEKEEVLFQKR